MTNRRRWRVWTMVIAGVLLLTISATIPYWMTLLAPKAFGGFWQSEQIIASAEIASIAQQFKLYMVDQGMTRIQPGTPLTVLTGGPTPYLEPRDLNDPWGRPYFLIVPGDNGAPFTIMTHGADGKPGGEGDNADISN